MSHVTHVVPVRNDEVILSERLVEILFLFANVCIGEGETLVSGKACGQSPVYFTSDPMIYWARFRSFALMTSRRARP